MVGPVLVLRSRKCLCAASHNNPIVPTVVRRRLVSEFASTPTTTTTPPAAQQRLLLVSRRAWWQQQQHTTPPPVVRPTSFQQSKTKPDELPWPRTAVYAFYAACSILVPYTVAWFLASHESWRTRLLLNDEPDNAVGSRRTMLLEWMRHEFGHVDERAMSEPERGALLRQQQVVPYKFVDECTAAVRHRQAQIAQQQNTPVVVRLFLNNNNENNNNEDSISVTLPAATRANPEAVRRALQTHAPHVPETATVALDFPVSSEPEGEEEKDAPVTSSREASTATAMSIYSLWHHHTTTTGNNATTRPIMSDREMHLSRLNHEIEALQQELQSMSSSRAIDDIQTDLRQKQSERRRLRRKQWRKQWLGV